MDEIEEFRGAFKHERLLCDLLERGCLRHCHVENFVSTLALKKALNRTIQTVRWFTASASSTAASTLILHIAIQQAISGGQHGVDLPYNDAILLLVLDQVLHFEVLDHRAEADAGEVRIVPGLVQLALAQILVEVGLQVEFELEVILELLV